MKNECYVGGDQTFWNTGNQWSFSNPFAINYGPSLSLMSRG